MAVVFRRTHTYVRESLARRSNPLRYCIAIALAGLGLHATPAEASSDKLASRTSFNIPPQNLSTSLKQLADQTGIQILYEERVVQGHEAPAIVAHQSALQALDTLLSNTDLEFTARNETVAVRRKAIVTQQEESGGSGGGMPSAAPAPEPTDAQLGSDEIEYIVVTARRKQENLQEVPQSVTAITAEAIEDLNLLTFDEIQKVVPGLFITSGGFGAASMRGVTFNVTSGASSTVEFYLNDVPMQSSFVFQSMYDVGQIEVLKGPQGTLRGRAAPSGSITITTRKPDLAELGGSASLTATDLDATNLQAAVNIPIVEDKLAIRVAAVKDETDAGGVKSAYSSVKPSDETESWRVTARFEPIDSLRAMITYQELENDTVAFGSAIYGNGAPGGNVLNTSVPAPPRGYNGPVIADTDFRTVTQPSDNNEQQTALIAQLDYAFAGQVLSYVGSRSRHFQQTWDARDLANMLPDYEFYQRFDNKNWYRTHELRLASEERIAGRFDYVIGAAHDETKRNNISDQGMTFNPGAFGTPTAQPILGTPDTRYSTNTLVIRPGRLESNSVFANVTGHFWQDRLEVAVGGRYDKFERDLTTLTTATSGIAARVLSPAACATARGTYGATYAGVCDVPVGGAALLNAVETTTDKPWIYNASISYRILDDLFVFANTGNSFRVGPANPNPPPNVRNDPVLNSLIFLDSEESRTYEVGIKSMWLDKRLLLNLTYYHQIYDGLLYSTPTAWFLSDNGIAAPQVASRAFLMNAPAIVDGIELETTFRVTPNWNVRGTFAWQDGRLDDALIPCNDGNFDGVLDTLTPSVADFESRGILVARCPSTRSISTNPDWNFNIQSEYSHALFGGIDGFVRGLWAYNPRNPNASQTYVTPSYSIINLYLGVHDAARNWEVSLFAKNLNGADTILTKGATQVQSTGGLRTFFGESGYFTVTNTPRREYGINVRYAFGSR